MSQNKRGRSGKPEDMDRDFGPITMKEEYCVSVVQERYTYTVSTVTL